MNSVIVQSLENRSSEHVIQWMMDYAKQMHWLDALSEVDKVVIKPNLCYLASPESGITTNVKTVEALILYLRKLHPEIKIVIVESDNIDRKCQDAFEQLGYKALSERYDLEILNLTSEGCQEVVVTDLHYSIKIPDIFFENVFFVSIANLKVHSYQKMTGIYKNQFGCVPDEIKERYHQYLEETLHALNSIIKPDISIIDGKIGLEGIGPVTGTPILSNVMLMSNSPLAVDAIAAKIMGLKPKEVPHLKYSLDKAGLKVDSIRVLGIKDYPVLNFKTDSSFELIRTKINITRLTDSMNKSFKSFVSWVYNIPFFIKRAYGYGMRKLRKVVGK